MRKIPMSIILLQCKPLNKRFTIQLNKITSCLLCPVLACCCVWSLTVCFVLLQWHKKIGLSHLIATPSSRLTTYNKLSSYSWGILLDCIHSGDFLKIWIYPWGTYWRVLFFPNKIPWILCLPWITSMFKTIPQGFPKLLQHTPREFHWSLLTSLTKGKCWLYIAIQNLHILLVVT